MMEINGIAPTIIYAGVGGIVIVILLFMVAIFGKSLNMLREIGDRLQVSHHTQEGIEKIGKHHLKTQLILENAIEALGNRCQRSTDSVVEELKATRAHFAKELTRRDKEISEKFQRITNLSMDLRDFYAALKFFKEGMEKSASFSGNLSNSVADFSSSVRLLKELVQVMEQSIQPVADPIERLYEVLKVQNQLLEQNLTALGTHSHGIISAGKKENLKILESIKNLEGELGSLKKQSQSSLEQINKELKQISGNTKRRFF